MCGQFRKISDRQMVEAFVRVAVPMNHAIFGQLEHIHQRCPSDLAASARRNVLRIACNAERIYPELTFTEDNAVFALTPWLWGIRPI